MENNTDQIIEELYKIDPTLKASGTDLKAIVSLLINSKPNVLIDENFVRELRSKILSEAQKTGFNHPSPYWNWVYKLTPLGAIAGLILVLMSRTPQTVNDTAPVTPPQMMLQLNASESAPSLQAPSLKAGIPLPDDVAQKLRAYVAKEFNTKEDNIVVLAAIQKDWPDACLGQSVASEMCAEVITPGWEITVSVSNKEKTYRTNTDGSVIKPAQ